MPSRSSAYLASLKPIALRLGASLPLSRVLGHDPRSSLTTLLYHHFFAPGESRTKGRDRLLRQLDWLQSRYRPLALSEAVEHLTQGTLPEFPLVITIDDAKVELLEVYDEFVARGVPITVGVVTGWTENEEPADAPPSISRVTDFLEWYRGAPRRIELPGGGEHFWIGAKPRSDAVDYAIARASEDGSFVERAWSVLAGIEGREPGRLTCTWSELRDLHRRGAEIASHTVTHCRLAAQSDMRQRFELAESKAVLEERLGPTPGFLYPFGRPDVVSERTTDLVMQTGYRYACLTHPGFATAADSPFYLPRIVIPDHQVEIEEFRARVSGVQVPLQTVQRMLGAARGATGEPPRAAILRQPSQLASVASAWTQLRQRSSLQSVSLQEYERLFGDPLLEGRMRLVVLRDGSEVVTLAPFVLENGYKKYTLGARKLGALPVRWLRLVGDSFIGDVNATTVRRVFDQLATCDGFDLVTLGEVPMDGALYRGVQAGLVNSGWRHASPFRQPSEHWVIDLPETFEAYMAQFSRKTRQNRKREMRIFQETYAGRIEYIRRPEDVDRFLEIGERISRRTYQWNVGQRLVNDEATRRQYRRNAEAGVLRCYLAFAGDEPCAFARGLIRDQTFHYETPGYDPQFAKASPGSVLLLKVIEDLITDSDCKLFDFGMGGDLVGYKSVYGTRSYKADVVELGRRLKPYPALLFGAQDGLLAARRVAHAVLGQSELTQAIRRRLRQYGDQ